MNDLRSIPKSYLTKCEKAGTVLKVNYEAKAKDGSDKKVPKYAYVYLPYEYDKEKKYDVLYCLHGGGGEMEVFFGEEEHPAQVKNTLDNMINNGDISPLIAVSPTYYAMDRNHDLNSAVSEIKHFCQEELVKELIPVVEKQFSTYGSREHRGYAGYSMGSLSTWYTFLHALDHFKYFMPMSGDLWIDGESKAKEAREWLEQELVKSGYGEKEFYVYAVTGDEDIAYERMKNLLENIKEESKIFKYITQECLDGNIGFHVEPGATHDYMYMPLYFYNGLPHFFDNIKIGD